MPIYGAPDPEELSRVQASADKSKELLERATKAVHDIIGAEAPWVLTMAPRGHNGILTCGNIDTPEQIRMLQHVLHSLDQGESIKLVDLKLDPVTGKPVE